MLGPGVERVAPRRLAGPRGMPPCRAGTRSPGGCRPARRGRGRRGRRGSAAAGSRARRGRRAGARPRAAYASFSSSNPRVTPFAARWAADRGRRTAKWHQSPGGNGQASSWGHGASVKPPAPSTASREARMRLVPVRGARLEKEHRVVDPLPERQRGGLDVLLTQLVQNVRDEHEIGSLAGHGHVPFDPRRLAQGLHGRGGGQRAAGPNHGRLDLDQCRPLELRPHRGGGPRGHCRAPRRRRGRSADASRGAAPPAGRARRRRRHRSRARGRRRTRRPPRPSAPHAWRLGPLPDRPPRGAGRPPPPPRGRRARRARPSPRAARPAGREEPSYAEASAGCRTRSRAAAKWIAS